jgi:hypothetical protein
MQTEASEDRSNKFIRNFLFSRFNEIANLFEIVNMQISLIYIYLLAIRILTVRFEVSTAVTMKNAVFWDLAPCRSCVNAGSSLADFSTLKIEEIRSSETSVHTKPRRRYIKTAFFRIFIIQIFMHETLISRLKNLFGLNIWSLFFQLLIIRVDYITMISPIESNICYNSMRSFTYETR